MLNTGSPSSDWNAYYTSIYTKTYTGESMYILEWNTYLCQPPRGYRREHKESYPPTSTTQIVLKAFYLP